MDSIKINKINNIIKILVFLFILTNEAIINNPKVIEDYYYYYYYNYYNYNITYTNPLIYFSNEKINFYFSGQFYTQNITTREVRYISTFCNYSSPYLLIRTDDTSKPLYIYSSGSQYLISISNRDCYSLNITGLEFPSETSYINYMNETGYSPLENTPIDGLDEITGLRCKSLNNEKIIYGKVSSNEIIFTFIQKKVSETLSSCSMEDYITCNVIANSAYLCALICNSNLYIKLFVYQTKEANIEDVCEMKEVFSEQISFMSSHTGAMMVDGKNENTKIICAKNKDDITMECFLFRYDFSEELLTIDEVKDESDFPIKNIKINNYNLVLTYEEQINFSFSLYENNNDQCVLKESILDEYLLCCGGTGIVTCGRMDKFCNFIDSFSFTNNGIKTQLDFIVYSSYINLFYMNEITYNDTKINKLYEYTIILPSCVDKAYSVIPLHSFNDFLYNLVRQEMNTNYYIEFKNIPTDYGNLTVNDEIIDLNNTNKIFVDNYKKFEFISLSEETVKNFEIKYLISIKETFSSECFVYLNILECYKSCKTCTKSGEESTAENHNCKPNSCNDNYYLDPDINTNCWRFDEGKSNWYLDYDQNKYLYCNDSCASCDGPTDSDCLSCKSNNALKYLANKKCYNKCPDGFYPSSQSSGYFKCEPCFETCGTCSEEGGDINNMKCNSCKENTISFRQNCFFQFDSSQKSFIMPGTNTISSCYEEFDLFIIANIIILFIYKSLKKMF